MGYYDNVKDSIKDKNGGSSDAPSFDTLKEDAEKTEPDDEPEGDDTDIEVLEEGLKRKTNRSSQQNNQAATQSTANAGGGQKTANQQSGNSDQGGGNPMVSESQEASGGNQDLSSIEEKLDKMIEQNERIIQILDSFGS